MIITSPKRNVNITIIARDIERISQTKYLGFLSTNIYLNGVQFQHINSKIIKKTWEFYINNNIMFRCASLYHGLSSWVTACQTKLEKKLKKVKLSVFAAFSLQKQENMQRHIIYATSNVKTGRCFKRLA